MFEWQAGLQAVAVERVEMRPIQYCYRRYHHTALVPDNISGQQSEPSRPSCSVHGRIDASWTRDSFSMALCWWRAGREVVFIQPRTHVDAPVIPLTIRIYMLRARLCRQRGRKDHADGKCEGKGF